MRNARRAVWIGAIAVLAIAAAVASVWTLRTSGRASSGAATPGAAGATASAPEPGRSPSRSGTGFGPTDPVPAARRSLRASGDRIARARAGTPDRATGREAGSRAVSGPAPTGEGGLRGPSSERPPSPTAVLRGSGGPGAPGGSDESTPSPPAEDDGESLASGATGAGTGDQDLEGRGEPIDPVEDAEAIEYVARCSLDGTPTETALNERRGWARTLLSAESEAVRERVRARAAAGLPCDG